MNLDDFVLLVPCINALLAELEIGVIAIAFFGQNRENPGYFFSPNIFLMSWYILEKRGLKDEVKQEPNNHASRRHDTDKDEDQGQFQDLPRDDRLRQ